ncbi:MAG: HEAT repeat domain-containing protein [Bacteroidetes bacterium]|nr:HEAT repeat domain-containing protein [Bacteroidota bacterium]
METHEWQKLMERYNSGRASREEIQQIEEAIESGEQVLSQMTDFTTLSNQLKSWDPGEPSMELNSRFYESLADAKRGEKKKFVFHLPTWNELWPRLAFGVAMLIIGFGIGYMLPSPSSSNDVAQLHQQVSELKEMMMLSMLEKESATDRLKAVSLTNEMDQASKKVTTALLQTLNTDANVNVRLAAIEALKPYVQDSGVREGLIQSIAKQESPLVQMSLAELMAAIQEKKSVTELKKLLQRDRMPNEVKKKISQSIDILI